MLPGDRDVENVRFIWSLERELSELASSGLTIGTCAANAEQSSNDSQERRQGAALAVLASSGLTNGHLTSRAEVSHHGW